MRTTVCPLGSIRRLTPLLGLAIGGPVAAVYAVKNPIMLAEQNLFALSHVLLCVVIGGIFIVESPRSHSDAKPMMAFGCLLLVIGLGFFLFEYSPELWRSLAIVALWCWCLRWLNVNMKVAARRRQLAAQADRREPSPASVSCGLSILDGPESELDPVS